MLPSLLLSLALASDALAAPAQKHLDTAPGPFNPLKHLSAISPFFIPSHEPTPLPADTKLTRVSLLIRHSCIQGNDDEFEETMQPFIQKIYNTPRENLPSEGEWAWLRDWKTPITDDTLEVVSHRGIKDAKALGKYIRGQYDVLFPSKEKKKVGKKGKGKVPKTPYKVWTASSQRDIDTAQSYIKGAFPSHQQGDDGSGDGDVVQLIKVPNKAKDWDRSLTPHKACDAFEKKSSLEPANKWLSVYSAPIKQRLKQDLPKVDLNDQDILAMAMLCGYESISQEHSHFCHVFTESEWRDHEYYFDIRFHYMMGYGNPLSPYLGMPWVKTALHLLEGKDSDSGEDHLEAWKSKLPKPKLPPNATHTQGLHASFTHRESPAFVATFLNLYNSTTLEHSANLPPALDYRPNNRSWRTSHLVSFLGHIALERFHHKGNGDYVRAVVNGKQEIMYGCQDGIGGSCKWKTFKRWVNERAERWGDWESVCEKE